MKKEKNNIKEKTVKESYLFIDVIENGNARVIPDKKGSAFNIPLCLLPDGAKEGTTVKLSAEITENTFSAEIDDLLSSLGSTL